MHEAVSYNIMSFISGLLASGGVSAVRRRGTEEELRRSSPIRLPVGRVVVSDKCGAAQSLLLLAERFPICGGHCPQSGNQHILAPMPGPQPASSRPSRIFAGAFR